MADIFLSYDSTERDRIQPLVQRFEEQGWSVWWDGLLETGSRFTDEIERQLQSASCVVVAWSESSIRSSWCLDEAGEGLKEAKLVPLRIDEVQPPLGFRSTHTASMVGWPAKAGQLDALLRTIQVRLGSPGALPRPIESPGSQAVAVLPFSNLSPDPEQDYFCDGLVDDLIDLLARESNLRVIARTSSFQFREDSRDVREIGRRLDVSHLIEGSVRTAGNRIRVNVRLLRSNDGINEWTNHYDAELEDLFDVQDRIANAIAGELGATLNPSRRKQNPDPQAHLLLLQARHILSSSGDDQQIGQACKLLEQALSFDVGYAGAWQELSRAYAQLIMIENRRGQKADPAHATALREAQGKALAIDPQLPEAVVNYAWSALFKGDRAGASATMQRALVQDPGNTQVLHGVVRPLIWCLRFNDAIRVGTYVVAGDPLNVIAISNLALALMLAGRTEEAERQLNAALTLNERDHYSISLLCSILLDRGEAARVMELAGRLADGFVERSCLIAMACHSLGRTAERQRVVAELERRWPEEHYPLARVRAWLGDADEAFAHLASAQERGAEDLFDFDRFNTMISLEWRSMHKDPRWQQFLEQTNQTPRELAEFDLMVELPER